MAKKQNKCWTGFVDSLALDASNQGPSINDIMRVRNTPSSAFAAARVAFIVRNVLRTLNQDLDAWTDQNMDAVSRRAGQIASLPFQLGESTANAFYEAALKPFGKFTGLNVIPPKEKEYDNNNDDNNTDLDDEGHDGLTKEEIDALLQEIEQEEANQDDETGEDVPLECEEGEDCVE